VEGGGAGSNAEVLAGAWRAYAGGDVEALASLMWPDATWRDDTRERRGKVYVCRDGAAIRGWLRKIRSTDGWNLEGGGPVEVIEPAANKVILRLRWREGGKTRDLHQLYVLRDGRVHAIRDYWSRGAAMEAASGGA
jgi:ketosteroid isomerase-like protein